VNALKPNSKVSEQLLIYKELAVKLNSKYILIHLPKSSVEHTNFKAGLQLIVNQLIKNTTPAWDGTVLLEVVPLTLEMISSISRQYANMPYSEFLEAYFKPILEPLSKVAGDRIKIVLDTAHLLAFGCKTLEDFLHTEKYLEKYLTKDVIHLNGNVAGPFMSDEHIPFIVANEKYNQIVKHFTLENYSKLLMHIFENYRIVVSENNFTKYTTFTYKTYKEWADKNRIPIIPSPEDAKYEL
jgi:hypothetical protein